MAKKYREQEGQPTQGIGSQDAFSYTPPPRVEPTDSGYKQTTTKLDKGQIYRNIQAKKNAGQPLSNLEKKFEKDYLGIDKKAYSERYDQDIIKAELGEMKWEELNKKYPRKREEIETFRRATLPKLERSPKFRMRKGLPAYFSKEAANIDKTTLKVIDQIEKEEDLKELLERKDEAKVKGIDVKAILEYYGKTEEEVNAFSLR